MTRQEIESAVCNHFGIAPKDIDRRRILPPIVLSRWHIWRLTSELLGWSTMDIVSYYRRSPQAIRHGITELGRRIASDQKTRDDARSIEAAIASGSDQCQP